MKNAMDGNSTAIRNAANQIKRRLTMRDVLEKYGFPVGYGNRIPCPLHNGHDRNFRFKPHYYKCFVCGATGTVIDFVSALYELDFPSAVRKLNEDFWLSLPIDRYQSRNERQEAKNLEAARMRERAYYEMRNNLVRDLNRAMFVANDALKRRMPEEWTPQEVQSIREYPILEYVEEAITTEKDWKTLLCGETGTAAQKLCQEILGAESCGGTKKWAYRRRNTG